MDELFHALILFHWLLGVAGIGTMSIHLSSEQEVHSHSVCILTEMVWMKPMILQDGWNFIREHCSNVVIPIVEEEQPPVDLENEEESYATMDGAATPSPDSSDLDVPHHLQLATRYPVWNIEMPHSPASLLVWLTERIDNRVLRGTYSQTRGDAKKGPLSQFLGDCLIHQGTNDQQILMDLVKQLPDLTDDENSPIHQLSQDQIELEFRQAHQAVQVGSNLLTRIAMAAEFGSAPTTASAVVNAVADAMMTDEDNELALHMRAMNESTE